jgi:hypothetical protein
VEAAGAQPSGPSHTCARPALARAGFLRVASSLSSMAGHDLLPTIFDQLKGWVIQFDAQLRWAWRIVLMNIVSLAPNDECVGARAWMQQPAARLDEAHNTCVKPVAVATARTGQRCGWILLEACAPSDRPTPHASVAMLASRQFDRESSFPCISGRGLVAIIPFREK